MNFKKAFTLAEALIVLLIVGIIAVAAIHNMSKKGPQRADEAQHGQYACWHVDKGAKYEAFAVGRRVLDIKITSQCKFEPGRKDAKYIIYTVGATNMTPGTDSTTVKGQLTSGSFSGKEFDDSVAITFNSSGTSFGNREDLFANSSVSNSNGVVAKNVRSCRLKRVPFDGCKRFVEDRVNGGFNEVSGTPIKCELVETKRFSGTEELALRINGCEMQLDDDVVDEMIKLSSLHSSTGSTYNAKSYDNKDYEVGIQLFDSSYTLGKASGHERIKELLSRLPKSKKSDITDVFTQADGGISNKPASPKYGAVFIMW